MWNLLADVGGFHDGLYLIVGILLGPYSAIALKVDLIDGRPVDVGNNSQNRNRKNSTRFKEAMAEISAK